MRLIDEIIDEENMAKAIKKVKSNKGAPGMDYMSVDELEGYFHKHQREIVNAISNKRYKPKPIKRVYIPKPDGGERPLGIPTVADRVIQQATARELTKIFNPHFSDHSYKEEVHIWQWKKH